MKNWSIKWRLLLLAFAPAITILVLLVGYFTNSRIKDINQSLSERGSAIARQLAPASEYGLFTRNGESLQTLTDSAKKEADVLLVSISDSTGMVLAASGDRSLLRHTKEKPQGVSLGVLDFADMLYFSLPVYQSEAHPGEIPEQGGAAIATPQRGLVILGWVNVTLSKASTISRTDALLRISMFLAVIVLGATAVFALRLTRAITQPISHLVRTMETIEAGELDVGLTPTTGGELAVLAKGVNSMAASIKASREGLQEKVDRATVQLTYYATHDSLTGLVNRREFEDRLGQALLSARQNGSVHALCFMDLDHFKIVNDTCGHDAGDELLRQVASLLKYKIREGDTLARVGGDEFGLLMGNCQLDTALELAHLLCQTIRAFRFSWSGKAFTIGASIGIVVINRGSDNISSILSRADSACYSAKDSGRNQVYVYRERDDAPGGAGVGKGWATRINEAFDNDDFAIYYQPIAPLQKNRDDGTRYYEALLRLRQVDGEVILPMAFIPAAERYNMMQSIDRWVIQRCFADYRKLMDDAPPGMPGHMISINLSGHSLCDDKFSKFLEDQFAIYGIPPQRIYFEITETAAITNLSRAVTLIEQQKRIGCKFLLDDFGTGVSSFSYLKNLPVDGVKIDGVFVRDMLGDRIDFAMVEAINSIAHVMGLYTVAEYVENEATLNLLRDMGVDYAQGHFLGTPLPLEESIGKSVRGKVVSIGTRGETNRPDRI
ncbi:MAG: EAL domain-containing protein [Burkholderiales bacterium]